MRSLSWLRPENKLTFENLAKASASLMTDYRSLSTSRSYSEISGFSMRFSIGLSYSSTKRNNTLATFFAYALNEVLEPAAGIWVVGV